MEVATHPPVLVKVSVVVVPEVEAVRPDELPLAVVHHEPGKRLIVAGHPVGLHVHPAGGSQCPLRVIVGMGSVRGATVLRVRVGHGRDGQRGVVGANDGARGDSEACMGDRSKK